MVLKYFYSLIFSTIALFSLAQNNLFFTDTYNTNLYKSQDNIIIFNNNLFSILDDQHVLKVDSVFRDFFETNNIQIEGNLVKNDFQISYHYIDEHQNYLTWSKSWFQNYEANLLKILNHYTQLYLTKNQKSYTSIHKAVQHKVLLNAYFNFNNRVNDITNTKINISSKNIDIKRFYNKNILPNISLRRTITSAKNNYFNEAFYLNQASKYQYFIIAPNSKSRLIDCFSAHLVCRILNIEAPTYLNNLSYIKLHLIDTALFTENNIKNNLTESKAEFFNFINNPSIAFYNFYDLKDVNHILSTYNLKDLKKFVELYLTNNTINKVFTIGDTTLAYNHRMMNDSIHFKVNSYKFKTTEDSTNLESIATFLINNPLKEIQILGLANQNEYLKVDNKKYLELIEIYQSYTPIKVSKKRNLPFYRALIVFEYLFKKGVAPESMICISKKVKHTDENKAFVYFSYKL